MDRATIQEILPHRDSMLLIDEADVNDGVSTGRYTVRGDEFFLRGHFPDNPVVPGVILCEMMGQSACLLIQCSASKDTPYFTMMSNVKFRRVVRPGETICFQTEIINKKMGFYFVKGVGRVGEELCVQGELSFVVKEE